MDDRGSTMTVAATIAAALLAIVQFASVPAFAQKTPMTVLDTKKAQGVVEERLRRLNSPSPVVAPIMDESVARLFTRHVLISVRFRMYPVAVLPPDPLKPQNLFAVQRDGSVEQINTVK